MLLKLLSYFHKALRRWAVQGTFMTLPAIHCQRVAGITFIASNPCDEGSSVNLTWECVWALLRGQFGFSPPEQLNRWPCHSVTHWVRVFYYKLRLVSFETFKRTNELTNKLTNELTNELMNDLMNELMNEVTNELTNKQMNEQTS